MQDSKRPREEPAPGLQEEVRVGAEGCEAEGPGLVQRDLEPETPRAPPALQSGDRTSLAELEAPAPEAPGTRGRCPNPRPDASSAAARAAHPSPGTRTRALGPVFAGGARGATPRGWGPPEPVSPRPTPTFGRPSRTGSREGQATRGLSRSRKGRAARCHRGALRPGRADRLPGRVSPPRHRRAPPSAARP